MKLLVYDMYNASLSSHDLYGGVRRIPLLSLKVSVIGALDLARLHEDLRGRAIHALLESCEV